MFSDARNTRITPGMTLACVSRTSRLTMLERFSRAGTSDITPL
jgi:hypothetical protein